MTKEQVDEHGSRLLMLGASIAERLARTIDPSERERCEGLLDTVCMVTSLFAGVQSALDSATLGEVRQRIFSTQRDIEKHKTEAN